MKKESPPIIPFSHDALFKKSLSDLKVARDFFHAHLPEVVKTAMDFNTLRLEKGSFIDEELRQTHTDMLFSVQLSSGTGLLYLLTEHQSQPDNSMALRLLEYTVQIIRHYHNKQGGKWPLVFPLVYYHGRQTLARTTLDLMECFHSPQLAKIVMFNQIHFIDLNKVEDKDITQHGLAAVMEILHKHVYQSNILPTLEFLAQEGLIQKARDTLGESYILGVLNYIYQQTDTANVETVTQILTNALPTQEENIMTIAQRIAAKAREEAFEEARRESMTIAKCIEAKAREEAFEEARRESMTIAKRIEAKAREEAFEEARRESMTIAKRLLAAGIKESIVLTALGLTKEELKESMAESKTPISIN